MGFWRSILGLDATAVEPAAMDAARQLEAAAARPTFATTIDSGVLYGADSIDSVLALLASGGGAVSRDVAIRVPSIKKARDLVCGGLGQIPLNMHNPAGGVESWSLFEQPEEGRAPVNTWTDVLDDMFFHKTARLRVTHVGWHGKPAQVERMKPGQHTAATGGWWLNRPGKAAVFVPKAQVIEIESPHDELLKAGARAIRVLSFLEAGALNAVNGVPMNDYFAPASDEDPFETDAEVIEFLNSWKAKRASGSTGYVPAGLEYKTNSISPKDLQLVEAREMAITEIARLTGVDAEELGISTTSRTYFNAQDRRRHLLDFVFGPYRRSIESRLSMPDVTPRGYTVRFDTAEFARADDFETAQTEEILLRSGVLDVDEVRARRNLPPRTTPAPTPEPAPQEAPA